MVLTLSRTNFTEPSGATKFEQDEGCNNSLPFVNGSGNDQIENPSANPGNSLADNVNMDFLNPNNSPNSARKQCVQIDQPPYDVAGRENVFKLEHKYNTRVTVEKPTLAPHAFINQDPGDSMTEAFQQHEMCGSYLQFEDAENKLETNWLSQTHLDGEVARSLSLTRQQTPFNTIQLIPCPKRYLLPTPTMSIAKPSSSGLHQLKTNQHSQIHSDGEGARSLSLARKQTPFNTIQPFSYPEQYLDPIPIMSMTKPSSSGLRLNNLFNSGAIVNMKSSQMVSSRVQEKESKPLFNSVAESLLRESTDDDKLVEGSILKSLLSAYLMKSSNKSVVLNQMKDQSTQADKNKRNAENVGDGEAFHRPNPKKGRQTQMSCQCKKTKCMKLYCECFAARFYCTEACSCQGCFNLKICDDEVHEARELIEARNPLAFAPKVVQNSIEPSASGYGEDGTRLPPSSARHIRGCKCKKSMCLKKYCDCYQSKVGCSDGCRCEGCQNVYGQKGEKSIRKGPLSGEENNQGTDSSFFDSFNMPAPTNDSHNAYLGTNQNSTPQSPPFLHSNQEDDESKFWTSLESLESSHPYLHLDNNDSVPANETLDPLWSHQEPDLGNAETKDEFEFPVPCHKPEETDTIYGVPNYMEWTNSSALPFPSGSGHYSCASSQNWHGSQISPLLDFKGNKLDQVVAYESESGNILKDNQPETLEEPPMSLNTVKVSSQNKKRVSSLRDPVQEFGSSSLVGLPKSIPASPVQQMKDPQDRGGNK
ncbi:uncharacterized protein [Primulina huaijiensis]|uniref:uncharacterized protein n=1 Tax=Primulina huaijiensis TaxID=1492673 RepID=UPI003CC70AD5